MKRYISVFVTLAIIFSLLSGIIHAESGPASGFKDVKDSDWFAEAVGKMTALKIIDGMPGAIFNPQRQVTRAEFVKMLVQAMEYKKTDSISFDDLKPFESSKPHWACVYIETALRNGVIVKAEIGDSFFPDVPLKRTDMGMMMFRALKLTPSEGENPFADLPEANGYLTKLYEEYLIRGSIEGGSRLYKPEGLTTRAEAAVIISRMVEYKENPEEFKAMMKEEEKYALTPKRLYENPKYLDGRTMEQAHNELLEYLEEDGFYLRAYDATAEEVVKIMTELAKGFINVDWNIDYRTVEKTYADRIKPYITYDEYKYDMPRTISSYVDNKVVQEAVFYTSEDLVYQSADKMAFYVRGTVRFRYNNPTEISYLAKLNEKESGKTLRIGQWYDVDVAVDIAGDAADPEGKFKVFGVKLIGNATPIN